MALNDAMSKRFRKPERHSEVYDFVMNLNIIIQELKQERARIDSALSALEQLTPGIRKATPRVQAAASNGAGKKRRIMSAAARKAIGDAQQKRWAKQRKA
jgi:hypothetical protein